MATRIFLSLLFLIGVASGVSAQTIMIDEDFEDQDLTQNPTWTGDLQNYTFTDRYGATSLQMVAPDTNRSAILTSSSTSYGSWEFFIEVPATSSLNRVYVYLMSDDEELDIVGADSPSNANGYAIHTGGDNFDLVKIESGDATTILSSETEIQADTEYQLRVERSDGSDDREEGDWQIHVSEGYGSTPEPNSEVVNDNDFTSSEYFGLYTRFTVGFYDSYYFDSIVVTSTEEFQATQAQVSGPNTVDIQFNFDVEETTINETNFDISEYGTPVSTELVQSNTVRLEIPEQWEDGDYTVTIGNVESTAGEQIEDGTQLTFEAENPFFVEDAIPRTDEEIAVQFSEAVDTDDIQTTDFSIENVGSPDNLSYEDENATVILHYDALDVGDYELTIDAILAESGWLLPQPAQFTFSIENPFFVERVEVVAPEQLQVHFSEEVVDEDLEPDNFEVDGIGNPAEITLDEGADAPVLLYDNPFPDGAHTLTIGAITSINGWQLPQPAEFDFFITGEFEPGDIVINEFMYRNPPQGMSEYVELYNHTDKFLSVREWQLRRRPDAPNPGGVFSEQDVIIPPDDYLVISPDTTTLYETFGSLNFVEMDNYPGFTSTVADDVRLFDADGQLADSLHYIPNIWGGNGVALERRNPTAPTSIIDNWEESPAQQGGTPGMPNLVEPITDPPEVELVDAVEIDRVRILFSRAVTEETGTDPDNFELSDDLVIENIQFDDDQITLELEQDLQTDLEYELTVRNISDVFGNVMPEQTFPFTFREFEAAEERDVVINEFLYRPGGSAGVTRFLELYNRSEKDINLDGWTIGRGTGTPITLSGTASADGNLPVSLPSGEHIVITADDSWVTEEAENVKTVSSIPAFSSLGDAIFIQNEETVTIDTLHYSPGWGGNQEGRSAERLDPEGASNNPDNWTTNEDGHTAGFQNANFEPDVIPPKLIFSGLRQDQTLQVYFDHHIRLDEETETTFSYNGTPLNVIEFDRHNADGLVLESPGNLPDDQDAILVATNLTDVAGNTTSESSMPISRPIEEGDVVINEIMYQPISDRYGDRPDQSEYLEFYNKRPYAISMEGVFIHDEPDRDDETVDINPVITRAKWIPSEGYAVMHGDPEPDFNETRLARFFDLDDGTHVLRADRTTLSLPDREYEINFADSSRNVIDQVRYHPNWHNQNLADVRGRSLERIRPAGQSSDGRNWSTTTHNDGGTPLRQNTLFSDPAETPDDEGITLEPDPFSPNADGRDETLNISWQLEETDYMMRIRIYDRHGRLVRTLAEGEQAGVEGTITWDGMKDDGTENRVGFYVVLFEAYNSVNGSDRTFKETVVLARNM